MINSIQDIQNWFYNIPPQSKFVAVISNVPIISNIFLEIKVRQLMNMYKKTKNVGPLNELSDLSTNLYQWAYVPKIAIFVSAIFGKVFPILFGVAGLLIASQIHHYWRLDYIRNVIHTHNRTFITSR